MKIIPYIEGDGIGKEITNAMRIVVDAAVLTAYGQQRIQWLELLAGEKAFEQTGEWLPKQTVDLLKEHGVGIKGPLSTPTGGGIRSLNVTLRQTLDLYCCQRPVQYFKGVPSPMKHPEKVDMVIFRENSEDIYAGVEFEAGQSSLLFAQLLKKHFNLDIKHPQQTGIGVKLISEFATKRLVKKAIEYAIENDRRRVTIVHKGNIMKYTEGAFMKWAYELIEEEYQGKQSATGYSIVNPNNGHRINITDMIADACFQSVLLHPEDMDIIVTMNLNGDYLSDAIAAQVGGIGIAPGANIGDHCALFEATHGTAPLCAGKNIANPSSLILSAEMMLRHIGFDAAANLIKQGVEKALLNEKVTQDFAKNMQNVPSLSTNDFAQSIIDCFK